MGAGEEVLMTLGGGAPWGFRLQGGSDQQKPLQVAKVRKRSKAGRAGLCENDVLLSINGKSCFSISHADAMHIIDSSNGTLHILVKRVSWSPEAESSLRGASPSARSPSPSKAPPRAPLPSAVERREIEIRRTAASPRESVLKSPDSITEANRQRLHVESYTSPPDSEAYYGETDSDADYITSEKQRRQKKKSPISSPRQSVKTSRVGSADEASEQSEYDSAPEHLHHSRPEPRVPVPVPALPVPAPAPSPSPGPSPGGPAAPELGSGFSRTAQPDSGARTCSQDPVDHRNRPPGVSCRNREAMFQPRRVEAKINIWQPQVEVASYPDSWPGPGPGPGPGGSSRQGVPDTSEADSGFQEVPVPSGSPEQNLLPSPTKVHLKDVQLVPMVGPVSHPVDEVLTTTYREKARQAKLHRSESVQEKQVKEARTKCKTIASLLTSAPNPHSKGVLMFKKRRQRAKKYTLVSYGSVDEDRNNLDEDGEILPTSESEFDEEAFSDAKSLTNQSTGSDWDSSYLDIEKPKSEPQGLMETNSKGVLLFEHQRQRAGEHTSKEGPAQMQQSVQQIKPKSTAEVMNCNMMNGDSSWSRGSDLYGETPMHVPTNVNISPEVHMSSIVSAEPHLQTTRSSQQQQSQPIIQDVSFPTGVINRTARPFTPGFVQNRKGAAFSITKPVFFRQNPPSRTTAQEKPTMQNRLATPFSPPPAVISRPAAIATSQLGLAEKPLDPKKRMTLYSPSEIVPYSPPPSTTPYSPPPSMTPYSPPPSTIPYSPPPSTIPYSPPPSMTPYSPPPSTTAYSTPPTVTPCSPLPSTTPYSPPPATYSSPPSAIPCSSSLSATDSHPLVNPYSISDGPVTTTATFHISSAGSQNKGSASANANTQASSIGSPSSVAWSASQQSENLVTREQRISIPAARTGILQEARKRSTRKPMFTVTELPKPSPNPELLSLVQNLDVKPKPDHLGAGFESGPEEDFLSLGAEASNFMQSQARKQKTPPPVAPKPHVKPYIVGYGSPLSNGNVTSGIAQLKGKGAELFAKRQSRMDKFVVESVPTHPSHPRVPSPTPSLPSTWKYSPNIRAPPPIGYNPMHSPSYPLAACRSQAATSSAKMDKKGKLGVNQKVGIKAIDFMRHQPYQLNPAMFNFDSAKLGTQSLPRNLPSTQPGKQNNMSFISTKHVPVKTTRAYEIKRFSTPVPTMTPTIIAPRSATTLAEPVWMSAPMSPPPALPQVSSAPRVSQPVAFTSYESPRENIQIQKKTLIQVPRPRFVVAKTGAHSHTWRPGV
eukprot:gi/632937285/ref/XP_007897964.1/ PREDICTED: synaptopodin 2-like protein [Callorhinchus milii]